jgi:hypothetical protein
MEPNPEVKLPRTAMWGDEVGMMQSLKGSQIARSLHH